MKIAIGCDHVGFELKGKVIEHLKEKGIEVVDFGTNSTERTDYPIYGKAVGEAVASGECDKGILICGTGVGISLAANKVKGIRAVVRADVTQKECRCLQILKTKDNRIALIKRPLRLKSHRPFFYSVVAVSDMRLSAFTGSTASSSTEVSRWM